MRFAVCISLCEAVPVLLIHILSACRHLDSDGDGSLSVAELKQALGDLGFGSRAQAAAEDMVQEAAGKDVGSIVQADFLQFFRRVCCFVNMVCCTPNICQQCFIEKLWSDGQGLYG